MKDHHDIRQKLWCDVYIAYVSASNSSSIDAGRLWADTALRRFDERFPEQQPEQETP